MFIHVLLNTQTHIYNRKIMQHLSLFLVLLKAQLTKLMQFQLLCEGMDEEKQKRPSMVLCSSGVLTCGKERMAEQSMSQDTTFCLSFFPFRKFFQPWFQAPSSLLNNPTGELAAWHWCIPIPCALASRGQLQPNLLRIHGDTEVNLFPSTFGSTKTWKRL